MFHGYILKSLKIAIYYIGHTDDLKQRVEDHDKGLSKYTRPRRPWELVYAKEFKTRAEAMQWEYAIKKRKDKKYIEKLIAGWKDQPLS